MGKLSAYAAMRDGNKSVLFDLELPAILFDSSPGRFIGYYVSVDMSADAIEVRDGPTNELFTIPASLTNTGKFIEVGGPDGLEYAISLFVDPPVAATGKIMFVFKDYPDL